MIFKLEIPNEIFSDAEAHLKSYGITLKEKIQNNVKDWCLEYRTKEAKKQLKKDIDSYLNVLDLKEWI